MDRRSARLMELGELEDPTKRIITKDFSPAALKTDLLRALNLEEMAHRTLQRRVAALIFARMHTPVSRTSFFIPYPLFLFYGGTRCFSCPLDRIADCYFASPLMYPG